MTKINREAGDKTKGFTLQKQRALALFFDTIKSHPNSHVNVAIEYQGDVFLQNDEVGYIEEQKNYEEFSTFSFNSPQILNTLVYFLEIWISEKQSNSIQFGFYSTNKTTKENNTERTKKLEIELPDDGLLNLLIAKDYDEKKLVLDSVRKYLVDEYSNQYSEDVNEALDDKSLTNFLNSIDWFFEQDNEKDYEEDILKKIKDSEFASNLKNSYHPNFVYAALMVALEKKQDETDPLLKFLKKDSVELCFLKVSADEEINIRAYKYLNFNFQEINKKTKEWLESFLKTKYFSNVKNKKFPELLKRKVAKHNNEVKIIRENLEQTNPDKARNLEVIIKELGDLINDVRPTFLFGEVGSGKSTLLAHYYLHETSKSELPIFITSTYLKGKIPVDINSLKSVFNEFVNNELNLVNKIFDLDSVILSKKEITLIIDGLDEFDRGEAFRLLNHLLTLSKESINLRIIASGRPLELQDVVNFNEWNCLTTLDLTEDEIKQLLKNEAIASGLSDTDSKTDASHRLNILKTKQELLANATTPLIVCLIRDFLDENLSSMTLGDILYEVVKRRLDWHKEDQKENFKRFLEAYPNVIQREIFIAEIAYKIHHSKDGKINEDTLFQIINSEKLIPKLTPERNIIVNEAIIFFKSNFLQKIGENYTFQSHQLFQLAIGIHLFNQTLTGSEFIFKQDRTNYWREISYASAIARTKGESANLTVYLNEFLNDLVTTNDNTAATSVLLAEAQITELNINFLEKLKNLDFRPLKFWGLSDSLVPHAYAYIFKDIGEDGFNWFFENYLNPIHPSRTGHDDIAVVVLRYYFIRFDFNLSAHDKNKLEAIIPFHLAAKTYSCNNLLPVLSLGIPDYFDVKDRCILLATSLKHEITYTRTKLLLKKELAKGNNEDVINALEIASTNKDSKPENAIKLWFELIDVAIPKLILDNCIVLISKGNDDLFDSVNDRIGIERFLSYCRYNALYETPISDAAAIILFNNNEQINTRLIGYPIMKKSSWFDFKDAQRETILDKIIYDDERGEEFIINNLPSAKRDLGIPEIYIKYFLTTLVNSNNLYINELLYVIKNLNKYSLSRYPAIRESFIKLLIKQEYYNLLKETLNGIDSHLRYKSASILLICNPEMEKEALEIIIRSSHKRPNDYHEWLRFCMKLNFSNSMLDFIYSLLDDLPEVSKVFAIKLLYHNNEYKLNDELLDEMISGLLGNASFLDWSGNLNDDGIKRVLSDDKFYEVLKIKLNSDNYKLKQAAADSLIYYHQLKLSLKEKAQCYLLHIQHSDYSLINFHYNHQDLFEEKSFITELKKCVLEIEELKDIRSFVFFEYYNVIKENGSWKDFFLALLNKEKYSNHHWIETLYGFFIKLGNNQDYRNKMGKAIKEIMDYPAYSQDKYNNFLFPQLAILAHEFGELTNSELNDIILNYVLPQDEIACSLLSRLNNLPEDYVARGRMISHIPLFSNNNVTPYIQMSNEELYALLEDGEDIPNNLIEAIEDQLLYGSLTLDDLTKLSTKTSLSLYFAIVIAFFRNEKWENIDFMKAEDIGSLKLDSRQVSQFHKNILYNIKLINITDIKIKEKYIASILKDISNVNTSKDIVDLFHELFELKVDFKPKLLPILFNAFIDVPYRINLSFIYNINSYLLNHENQSDKKDLVIPLKKCLKTINSGGEERRENQYELISWTLSLILIYLEGKSDIDTERGFLIGLKNAFMQKTGGNIYVKENNQNQSFYGRDIFIHSEMIINQIDNNIIQNIIKNGVDSNIRELRAICKIVSAVAGELN
ncbi:NACHT domain-containing protein [Thalassobellus suaedae]|uniref:NACHT domain-containing protein n=1 Tax=Thalassobellus suaedae TaxID=3074124 RepID=A0ABY9XZ87_9FLAO|nr:hypothetical protein RHP49_09485 [Flavobacteriaceae bacterium HL-DH10]